MTDNVLIESTTTDRSANGGSEVTVGRFLSEEEGWKVVEVAATWTGTAYAMMGAASQKLVKGDCSGSTNKIFVEAGFPYPYQSTVAFSAFVRKTNRFRKIDTTKQPMQAGDVLLWDGHMAIYAPFRSGDPRYDTGLMQKGHKVFNNMYTAFNARTGHPYGPSNIDWFRPFPPPPEVYRYYFPPGTEDGNK
jgi:hypothetical protein